MEGLELWIQFLINTFLSYYFSISFSVFFSLFILSFLMTFFLSVTMTYSKVRNTDLLVIYSLLRGVEVCPVLIVYQIKMYLSHALMRRIQQQTLL